MRIDVPSEIVSVGQLGRVHFVGIGGAGLSAIARIMLARGVIVSGSDGRDSPTLTSLRRAGAQVSVGHSAANVADADTLIVSTAIPDTNPEVVYAFEQGLRIWPRSAGLASVMLGQHVLAVAGTHGKTTTTSLLIAALTEAGEDPTYAVGGDLHQTGSNAYDGKGKYFVAEADESDGAFLVYTPLAAVITNVEADHLDFYRTEAAYYSAFEAFVARVRPEGFLVCVVDDPGAAKIATYARRKGIVVSTVGEAADADFRATNMRFEGARSTFTAVEDGRALGDIALQIPGRHYVMDALAALAVGRRLGLPFAELARGLAGFAGTSRRMEFKGEAGGVRVYDSYAHHPREIEADLQAARALVSDGDLIVAFQPHLVSRTRIFGVEMGRALTAAEQVVVLDVYLAREVADPLVTGQLVADAVDHNRVQFVPDIDAVPELLMGLAKPGDVILTLGAGTVTELGPRVLSLLQQNLPVRTDD